MTLALLFNRFIVLQELRILWILNPIPDMKRQRYYIIHVLINQLVVVSQIIKQGFLVTYKVVELKVVVHADGAEVRGLRGFEIGRGLVVIVSKGVVGFLLLWDYGVEVVFGEIAESFLEVI